MKDFDFKVEVPVKVPALIFPYEYITNTFYLVVSRVGSSVRVHGRYSDYSLAIDRAAEMSINYHRNYFVVQFQNYCRVL